MKLSIKAFSLTCGILLGLTVFLATLWCTLKQGGNTLIVLNRFYLGFTISIPGAFLGLLWGFIHGLVGGLFFSLIYNGFASSPR